MVKIGLEIHGYILTNEKLFCRCKAEHGLKVSKPNTNICPICTAQPGAKPRLPNNKAIKKAVEISLILGCSINEKIIWQRKHYDWPDLPKGYQNTLSGPYAIPIGQNGKFLGIKITEAHLEEDPAAWNPLSGEIDYNRSGSPLIEIVTEPDFKNSEEVIDWLKQLITTLSYIKAIDKKSGIKADVNISLPELKGKRVEVKNINGLKKIKSAIEYEIIRQKKEVPIVEETRMFDETKGVTIKMRSKEQAEDYRFITEPDLPIIKISSAEIKKIKSQLPETPHEKLGKIIKKHKIEKKSAEILIKKLDIVSFFEEIIKKANPKLAVRWVTEELLSVLNYNKLELEDLEIIPNHFVELLDLIEKNKISELKAKEILRSWTKKSSSPKKEIKKHSQISNKSEIEKLAEKVISENKKAVEDYKAGKKESINFLVGQVMKLTGNRADYRVVREVLKKLI